MELNYKYSKLQLLRMGEFNCSEFVITDEFQAKLEKANSVLEGTTKRWQQNQGPLKYPTEIAAEKLAAEELRMQNKHKNFLRREWGRKKKLMQKQAREESCASTSGYSSNSSDSGHADEKLGLKEAESMMAECDLESVSDEKWRLKEAEVIAIECVDAVV